jgi:prolipoprotein diacylglyceryltransferase
MLGAAVLLGVVLWLAKHWRQRHYGQMFSIWLIWYGFQRFLIDFTRLDAAEAGTTADSVMGPFTGSQWGALGGALLGVMLFVWFRRRSPVVGPDMDATFGASPERRTSALPEQVSS